jgi:hypothetical protein
MRKLYSFFLFILFPYLIFAQLGGGERGTTRPHRSTAEMQAVRITDAPRIDGTLDDACWQNLGAAFEGYFTQAAPDNGQPSLQPSRVMIAYTDYAIYVGAELFDDNPEGIQKEFGLRDQGGLNTDLFSVGFDTYYKRQNAFIFQVSAANVQSDIYITPEDEDENWNAIWQSRTRIHDKGWTVELEIPLVSLRFPKTPEQVWGLNFMRRIQRFQEEAYWHPVDPNINGFVNQFGTLRGLQDIKPPLRLQFIPYVSSYLESDGENGWSSNFNGGMDFKYGINESFTLDVSLIPDFGQVLSDNVVLNLSPFEVRFDENRPFFTEGTELFNRGSMFYSRRVGAGAGLITEAMGEHEVVTYQPQTAPLLNAAKLSGRNRKGLGIGFFNALTNHNFATVKDTLTGEERQVQADPLTNYNMLVIDQNLPNNSNIAFANTNVTRWDGGPDANVTGTDFSFFDKTNTYNVRGSGRLSQIIRRHSDTGELDVDLGYRYFLRLGKVSGKFQYSLERMVESYNFNPNDLGFLRAPNEISHELGLSYQRNEPIGIFNRYSSWFGISHTQLQNPREFEELQLEVGVDGTFRNFWNLGMEVSASPVDRWDHFEARTGTRVFIKPPSHRVSTWLGTDDRKQFRLNMNAGVWQRPAWNQIDNWLGLRPRFRFSDRFSVDYDLNMNWRRREIGFATKLFTSEGALQDIIMGERYVFTATNILNGKYSFSDLMGLTLRVRHYWSKVRYVDLFALDEQGYLQPTDYTGYDDAGESLHDANFNAFNIDMVYTWQFALGSTMSIVWKNSIYTLGNNTAPGFVENLGNTLTAPGVNSISIRILYLFDYSRVRRLLKRKG